VFSAQGPALEQQVIDKHHEGPRGWSGGQDDSTDDANEPKIR
jgi:hypothetical protein